MKRSYFVVFLLILFSLACSFGGLISPTPTPSALPATGENGRPLDAAQSEKRCGDGVCDGPETPENCPEDCGDGGAPEPETSGSPHDHWVKNPTSGNDLYVYVAYPDSGREPHPVLVLVPGGIGDSQNFLDRGMPARLTAAGFTVVLFDPDGRNNSPGEEDFDGHIHQDGLAAILEYTAGLPNIDPSRIGLVTFSYGITMGSGALVRYPNLPVIFLIDWEGPADRYDSTTDCTFSTRIDFAPCDDDDFWIEREALRFIPDVQIPYLRLQTEKDHVQPDISHALNMVHGAIAGGNPWVRLNDGLVNEIYDLAKTPPLLPESLDSDLAGLVEKYASEMLALHGE